MLAQLTIRNFAIVDRLDVAWEPGLNVITGETGAGKSIIIDAVGALLGDKLGPETVRTGADRALVEGVFQVGEGPGEELAAVLEEYGLEVEDGALIVSREIAAAGGRGGARVNGRQVPLSVLQQLGEQLVDIHGQSQHMALLRVREQLDYLDRYAGLIGERQHVAGLVRELRAVRAERQTILAEERQAAREQEMLRHEIAEIERAELRDGEEAELQAQRTRLEHVERLRQAASAAYEALNGAEGEDGERPGAVDLAGQAVVACQDGARFDPELAAYAEALNGAFAQLEEASLRLRSYVDTIEADPEALERLEERLFAIADLRRKYGDSVPEILAYLEQARGRVEGFEHREERLAELGEREKQLLEQLSRAAGGLSSRRRDAGARLAEAVERELADLQMRGTRFAVSVQQQDDPDGVELDGRPVAFDLAGVDRVELLIAPNAGEEPRALSRIASGGELARVALALKTILARADTRPTLIFDEVDVGVGGRTAPVVGQKLWTVAAGGHQVLCVTHMPQVAAFADRHWMVAKREADGRTQTDVALLEPEPRLHELAAMLAGSSTETARQNAAELVQAAGRFKRAAQPDGRAPALAGAGRKSSGTQEGP